MDYQNSQELYNALLKQDSCDSIFTYFKNANAVDDDMTSATDINLISTYINIFERKGKIQKAPAYLKFSGNKLKYSLWLQQDVQKHNEWLENNKPKYSPMPYMNNCDSFLVLLNNYHQSANRKGYAVVDVDSMDELWTLWKNGFPMFEVPFTLSVSKKMPHFYIRTDQTLKRNCGNKQQRELDLITQYVYEKKTSMVYGPSSIPTFTKQELERLMDFTLEYELESPSNKMEKFMIENKCIPATIEWGDVDRETTIFLNNVEIEPKGEVIPFFALKRLINALNPDNYVARPVWLKMLRAVLNMMTSKSNPMDYVKLLDDWYQNSNKYQSCWFEETVKYFVKWINDGQYENLGASFLFRELHKANRELWLELAFANTRELDVEAFSNLKYNDAVNVYNQNYAYLAGNETQYVNYNPVTHKHIFLTDQQMKMTFRNLFYTITTCDKNGECRDIKKPFLKAWMESTKRKTYSGGVCFAPYPKKPAYNQYNLFTGFELDDVDEFNDEIDRMSKFEMEAELEPVFQHLKYLSGEDRTDEVYEFQLKFFAHMLKYPGVLPRIAMLWVSVPGTGKNQWLNFLESIIGSKYYYSTANSKEIVGDFNDNVRGKILLNLNEFKNGYENMEAIKELITEKTISTREKHKNSIRCSNYSHIVFTTNNPHSMNIEYGDRRFFVVRNNPKTASKKFKETFQYGANLNRILTNIRIQKIFLAYCREHIKVPMDYNFETNIIKTDEYKILKAKNIPPIIRFIRWWYVTHEKPQKHLKRNRTAPQLYKMYQEWKIAEGEKGEYSKNILINQFQNYIIRHESDDYLECNPNVFIRIPVSKTGKPLKQKTYHMDLERCEAFLISEDLDVDLFMDDDDEDEEEYESSDC